MLDWFFSLLNLDAFQSIRTLDPMLNEKRIRERKMIVSGVGALAFLLAAVIFGETPQESPPSTMIFVQLIRHWTGLFFLFFASLSTLWFFVEWIGYVIFWKHNIE